MTNKLLRTLMGILVKFVFLGGEDKYCILRPDELLDHTALHRQEVVQVVFSALF
jgi:hypothetical protein